MSITRENPLRLSGLTQALDDFFQKRFSGRTFWVVGEVSSHKHYDRKGWHFFDLIEKAEGQNVLLAKMSAVAWRNGTERIKVFERDSGQKLSDGLEVLLQVEVSFHQQYGLKLTVLDIDAGFTLGQMHRKRQEVLQKLAQRYPRFITKTEAGYDTHNKRRDLPMIIQRIAVITSEGAAGNEDFVHTLENNNYGYSFQLDFYFTRVQGMEAAKTMVRRVLEIQAKQNEYDLVAIVRGGGAQADLFVFDDYSLNREIAKSDVPIWAGIGHQRDETIVDLFSHSSLKTPTKVAEAILYHNNQAEQAAVDAWFELESLVSSVLKENRQRLHRFGASLGTKVPKRIQANRQHLHDLNRTLLVQANALLLTEKGTLLQQAKGLKHNVQKRLISEYGYLEGAKGTLERVPQQMLKRNQELLPLLKNRLSNAVSGKNQIAKLKLANLEGKLKLLDPEQQLKRGYALVEFKGKVIRNAKSIQAGDELNIRMSRENLTVQLKEKKARRNDKDQSPGQS